MARQATIIGRATDCHGRLWDVRESRETSHGWPLLLGWPADGRRGPGGGGPRAIITPELAAYLDSMRLRPTDIDLPLGRTAIKRLRRALDHNWYQDNEDWWISNPSGPGKSYGSQHNWRLRLGIKSRLWTAEEDAQLLALRRDGRGVTAIAAEIGRSPQGVWARIRKLRKRQK